MLQIACKIFSSVFEQLSGEQNDFMTWYRSEMSVSWPPAQPVAQHAVVPRDVHRPALAIRTLGIAGVARFIQWAKRIPGRRVFVLSGWEKTLYDTVLRNIIIFPSWEIIQGDCSPRSSSCVRMFSKWGNSAEDLLFSTSCGRYKVTIPEGFPRSIATV